MINHFKKEKIGTLLRFIRTQKKLKLRDVGTSLHIDAGLLSKIERNERMPTRNQIQLFCDFYHPYQDMIYVSWLSERVLTEVSQDKYAHAAIALAHDKLRVH